MRTKKVRIGDLIIGGGSPVRVQSMTNTPTEDLKRTKAQISALAAAGCEIVRISIPSVKAAENIEKFKNAFPDIPLVADIHFDYRLALLSIERGIDKLRLNPGNITAKDKVAEIVYAARRKKIPIRIGINGGSLPASIKEKYHKPTAEALVAAAAEEIAYFKKLEYENIVVSLKSSDVPVTVKANRLFRERYPYPLHLGITEAGTAIGGTVKSAVGIGILLNEGIGDTLRISLSGDPVTEVHTGFAILRELGLRRTGLDLIACPTCSRTEIDVAGISAQIEKKFRGMKEPLRVAIMGCIVNGPGEASEADIGIVGTKSGYVIYVNGKIIKKITKAEGSGEAVGILSELIRKFQK